MCSVSFRGDLQVPGGHGRLFERGDGVGVGADRRARVEGLEVGLQVEAGGAIEVPHHVVVGRVAQKVCEVLTARPGSVAPGRDSIQYRPNWMKLSSGNDSTALGVLRGLDRLRVVRCGLGNAGRDRRDIEEREDERDTRAPFGRRLGGHHRRGERGSRCGALTRVREIDELGFGSRHEEPRDRVLRVELVVVEMDGAGDESAREGAPSMIPAPRSASSALTSPPIEVPNARTRSGACGRPDAVTASIVANWSLTAVFSAHQEPAGSYEEPASA